MRVYYDRDADVHRRKPEAFADAHFPVFLVQDAEVEGREGDDHPMVSFSSLVPHPHSQCAMALALPG